MNIVQFRNFSLDDIEFVFGIKFIDNAKVGQRIGLFRYIFLILQRS